MSILSKVNELKINGNPLTEEQKKVPVSIEEGNEITKVIAYAGAGKTSTLESLPNVFPQKRILYLVYNRKMREEAEEKFNKYHNVLVKTAHSIAYTNLKVWERFDNRIGNIRYQDVKNALNLSYTIVGGFRPSDVIASIIGTLNNFFYSSEDIVKPEMLPSDFHKKAQISKNLNKDRLDSQALAEFASESANKIFKEFILNENSNFPITHDAYLKIWSIEGAKGLKKYDLIMLDEAQDANPVILKSILEQKSQKVFVADPHQSIYSWRGAIDAMEKVEGKTCYLTQSFRFKNNIADIGNKILRVKMFHKEEPFPPLKGFEKASKGDGSKAIICRTNGECINQAFKHEDYGLVGDFREVIQLLKDLGNIEIGNLKEVKSRDLQEFKDLQEVEMIAESIGDTNLKGVLNLYKNHELEKIIDLLNKNKDTSKFKNHITTAHRSKGLEWSHVELAEDFKSFFTDEGDIILRNKQDYEQLNLIYVAATRAQDTLKVNKALKELLNYEKNNFSSSVISSIISKNKEVEQIENLTINSGISIQEQVLKP